MFPTMCAKPTPDGLQDRLIEFGAAVCGALGDLPNDLVGSHVSRQLIRSATSPAANYAEARGAESRQDFIHKMQLRLKELRETSV
jgi:four helix bundle protein